MDALFSLLASILAETARHLCGSSSFNIKNVIKFRSKVAILEKDMKILMDLKNNIKEVIELAEKDGKSRTHHAVMWLAKVEKVERDVSSVLVKVTTDTQTPCCCSCLSCSLSGKVVEMIKEVNQIMGESSSHPLVMLDSRVKAVERIPGPSIIDQKTASENLAKILELLKDDGVGIIGMLGMGGIGKTTLIRNLNNELESMDSAQQPFSVVIWVTISKDLNVERVQNRIAERLNMLKIVGESVDGKAIRLFNRLEKENKFIVILDDVWERIDLDRIGIPRPKVHAGSKIILTTRSVDVCREMETDVEFPVAVLSKEESWALFRQSAGETVDSEFIRPFAEAVTKECGGLPLAISTVGRAMRGKKKIELWKDALRALQRSNPVPYIKGIEKELFLPLKWSYDSLEGKNIGPCFLYCSLYPEDFSIEIKELLQCWVAEGLLDNREDLEEAYSMGISLIENLKDLCLLESGNREGTVRMHDVVRDVAIWIASSSEDGQKYLIRSGFGLSQTPGVEMWGSCAKISLMNNRIEMLPDCVPHCSEVSTLFLQGNVQLQNVPYEFLQGFQSLRVLNLSETSITLLPLHVQLGELRALFLRNCFHLEKFPSLEGLSRLQVLDLSGTSLAMSPNEVELMLKDLRLQENLLELYAHLFHVPPITLKDSTWLARLRRFNICIGSQTVGMYFTRYNDRVLYLYDAKSLSREYVLFWSNASALVLVKCQCIIEMWTSNSFVGLDCLKSLTVDNCSCTGSMGINSTRVLFPSLEVLSLFRVTNLWSISEFVISSGRNIRIIEIKSCHHLKKLLPFSLLHKLESLEEIYVNSCENLVEIITNRGIIANTLPNLRILELRKLPKLKSVCQQVMLRSHIKQIQVEHCPILKKLPLSSQHANTIQVIKGEVTWWNQLQWEREDAKSSLQRYFQPL